MLSVPTDDSPEQTAAVMQAEAEADEAIRADDHDALLDRFQAMTTMAPSVEHRGAGDDPVPPGSVRTDPTAGQQAPARLPLTLLLHRGARAPAPGLS